MVISKPILGITMGDPAGIGPEIAAKALACQRVYELCRPLVIGDADVIEQAIGIVRECLKVNAISQVNQAKFQYGTVDVLDLKNVDLASLVRGQVSAMAGRAACEAVVKAISLAMDKQIDATITGPINKQAINMAGFEFSGHTEIYAHYTNTKDYTMMLAEGNLRVVHVSTHVSLRQACDRVKRERVLKVIRLAHQACKSLGINPPRIGVAGLNPHSGEGGLFGREEIDEIAPAVEDAVLEGIHADGPIPADTLFSKVKGGQYDIAVAMYHDQGHIPVKVAGFCYDHASKKWTSVSGVNITLGLPIIRSSVDHGTAFDQAGKGTANADSLINAIEYGAMMALNWGKA